MTQDEKRFTPTELLVLIFWCISYFLPLATGYSQDIERDAFFIKELYHHSLADQSDYARLRYLTKEIGARPTGSEAYRRAVDYMREQLAEVGFRDIYTQDAHVPVWLRGADEQVEIHVGDSSMRLSACTLGHSLCPDTMISGQVVVFHHLDSLRENKEDITGRIVYLDQAMDQSQIRTFTAYGAAVGQRYHGPNLAAQQGAAAVLVRSIATDIDDEPHTGIMRIDPSHDAIPALAISTQAAEHLSRLMDSGAIVYADILCHSTVVDSTYDQNVIGEIKGSLYPDEIILAGGHLDSWDLGEGAHDDGAGCIHALEAFRLLLSMGYTPKRTWRCVFFANEEAGLSGANTYTRLSNEKKEYHIAAIESDAGGYAPVGFSFESLENVRDKIQGIRKYWHLLEPYHLDVQFLGSGADVSQLKAQGGLMIGLRVQSDRYFDIHHSADDVLEQVHPRELSLGAAAMASMIYIIDQYGIDP